MRNVLVIAPGNWRNLFEEPVPEALQSHPGFVDDDLDADGNVIRGVKTTRRILPRELGFVCRPVVVSNPRAPDQVLLDCIVQDDWTPPAGWQIKDDRNEKGRANVRAKRSELPLVHNHSFAGWKPRDFS